MEQIIAQAKKLGEAIAADARCKALKEARAALLKDEEASRLLEEYGKAVTIVNSALARGEPVEPEEKRREADARAALAANETSRAGMRAEADFAELMNSVNQAIQQALEL